MTYDLHGGGWEDKTGHNSPLKSHPSETGNETYLNVVSFQDNQAEKYTNIVHIVQFLFYLQILNFQNQENKFYFYKKLQFSYKLLT